MVQETIHKRLKPGTLVRVNRLNEYGIVLRVKVYWGNQYSNDDQYCYEVLVKGEKVSAYGEGFKVIGET